MILQLEQTHGGDRVRGNTQDRRRSRFGSIFGRSADVARRIETPEPRSPKLLAPGEVPDVIAATANLVSQYVFVEFPLEHPPAVQHRGPSRSASEISMHPLLIAPVIRYIELEFWEELAKWLCDFQEWCTVKTWQGQASELKEDTKNQSSASESARNAYSTLKPIRNISNSKRRTVETPNLNG